MKTRKKELKKKKRGLTYDVGDGRFSATGEKIIVEADHDHAPFFTLKKKKKKGKKDD